MNWGRAMRGFLGDLRLGIWSCPSQLHLCTVPPIPASCSPAPLQRDHKLLSPGTDLLSRYGSHDTHAPHRSSRGPLSHPATGLLPDRQPLAYGGLFAPRQVLSSSTRQQLRPNAGVQPTAPPRSNSAAKAIQGDVPGLRCLATDAVPKSGRESGRRFSGFNGRVLVQLPDPLGTPATPPCFDSDGPGSAQRTRRATRRRQFVVGTMFEVEFSRGTFSSANGYSPSLSSDRAPGVKRTSCNAESI